MATESDRCGLAALRAALATGAALIVLGAWASPSDAAQSRRFWYQDAGWGRSAPARTYVARRARSAAGTTGTVRQAPKADPGFGEMPKGPLQIVVSIGTQKVTLYSNGVRVAQGGVSTGQAGHLTPMGVFSVIEKDRYHHSNIYSGAPMPFMQRITWSGIALHEGVLPGYPASHGCIRMSHDFAQKLWPITKLGVRVIVSRQDVVPGDFQHAKLFVPKQKPSGAQVSMDDDPIKLVQVAQAMKEGVTVLDVTPAPGDIEQPKAAEVTAEPGINSPQAATDTREATPAEAIVELGTKAATDDDTKATGTVTAPGADDAGKAAVVVTPAQPADTNETSPARELRQSVELPDSAATKATPAATEPDKPVPPAAEPSKPIVPRMKAADQPQKRYGQVAVFVSRKEKKIFVRQGFAPVFEMPIVIDEPDRPLGTHVFTAMAVTDDGAGMRWNLMSIPTEPGRAAEPPPSRNRKHAAEAVKPPVVTKAPSTAAEALDRIQFPQEALDTIGELLIPGSSLLVSDEGISRETGRGTEFIVLTR